MKQKFSKLQNEQQQQAAQNDTTERHTEGLEFASVEEMLRHDASQEAPPPSVMERLQNSVDQSLPKPRPWWKRWFGS